MYDSYEVIQMELPLLSDCLLTLKRHIFSVFIAKKHNSIKKITIHTKNKMKYWNG